MVFDSAFSKMESSAIVKILASSWVTTTIVIPMLSRSSRISSSNRSELIGSRPAEGSSKKRISGSRAVARASAARFLIPPLISEG